MRKKIGKLIDMETLIHSYSPSHQSKQATPTQQCIQFDLTYTTTNLSPNLDYQSNSNNKVELETNFLLDLLNKCLDSRIKELVKKLSSILTPIAQDYQYQLNHSISIWEKIKIYHKLVTMLEEERRYKFFDKKLRKSLHNTIDSDLFNILKYMIHVSVSSSPVSTATLTLSFNKTALLCYLDKKEIHTLGRKVVVLNNDLNQDNLLDKLQSGGDYAERLKQYVNDSQTIQVSVSAALSHSFYLLTNEQYQLLKQEYKFSDLEFLDE